MHRVLIISISLIYSVNSYDTGDYDEHAPRQFIEKLNEVEAAEDTSYYDESTPNQINEKVNEAAATKSANKRANKAARKEEPEPINLLAIPLPSRGTNETTTIMAPLDTKNILCEDFEEYSENCTKQAKQIYNSTIVIPQSTELSSWCKALKLLTSCEYDWNTDCQDVTEKNFNEQTIQGQLHVLDRVCYDDWFTVRYDVHMDRCINAISKDWTGCYLELKYYTDQLKNSTKNWVHYETHFYLCCARTRFRRCTLEILLSVPRNCTNHQAVLLQKFSSIISEGTVFQDCNFNMMYASCPGGDPRPPTALVSKLMGEGIRSLQELQDSRSTAIRPLPLMMLFLLHF